MNEILGGSGFTSRITRSRSAPTRASPTPRARASASGCTTPAASAPASSRRAAAWPTPPSSCSSEIRKIRDTPVTAQELDTVKSNLIETFPSSFASKAQAMGIFAADEYTRRDPAYWATYRDRIQAVTAADVQRVAREYLVPEKLIVLVVGDQKEIDMGDGKHGRRSELCRGKATGLRPPGSA